jgi:uncharacterized protein (TIGR04255 family)
MTDPGGGIYPNSPLVETVFEVRYSAEPVVECQRDRYFAEVRDEFPVVVLPKIAAGQAPSAQPHHYRSHDEQEILVVGIDRFGLSCKDYPGFKEFRAKALVHCRRFCEIYGIGRLKRTGLRYINLIPFSREHGYAPVQRYFNLSVRLPDDTPQGAVSISLGYVMPVGSGRLTLRLECVRQEKDGGDAFLLDFDYAIEGELKADSLEDYLDESHLHTKQFFTSLITEEYLRYLSGEVVQ